MIAHSASEGRKLIIISAPSGSGKTTILREVLKQLPELEFSVSATTRKPREGEMDGVDYYFLSNIDFEKKIVEGRFLEWEEVYNGSFYGTLNAELERIWSMGRVVLFDLDVLGGVRVKKKFPEHSLSVFIMPPSIDELKRRLELRGTETPDSIIKRVKRAEYEIGFANQFDTVVINENLEVAISEVCVKIDAFLKEKA